MLYQLTGETRYVERAWKDIEAVCAFPNWNPSHYLDVGEMTAALGMCYDWMYDALTKDQRETIEKAIIEKGLTPTKKAYYGLLGQNGNFVNVDNNWNVVCNGGAVLAALAITSADPALCFDLVANAARSLEYMMCHFAPDGAWYEGAMYWGYTMSYMAKFLGSMDSVLGTDYGISNYPGFSHTGDFNLQINGTTSVNNFHDSATGLTNNAEVFWLADKMNRPDLAQARMATMKLHGFSGSLYDILWYDVNTSQEEIRLPLDDYFGDADVVTMRENWNSKEAMYASYHAGATSVNHGQLDNGTFVLDFLGERWATDFGGDDYNLPGYFGDQRYQYYRNRAEGHNIYVIDPDAGPELDLKSVTTVESLVSKPRGAISVANLAPGYGGKVSAAKRGYMLTDDRRTFVVRDEINLKQESGVYWFLHTQAQIDIRDDQTIFLTQNGKKLQLQLNVDAADYSVYVMDALPLPASPQSDKQNKNGGFHKIVIQFRDSGPVSITAKLCAANEYQAGQALEDVPIDKWKIPDGDIKPLPMLDGITADGKPLDGFAPDKTAYSIKLAPGYAGLPQIETQAQGKRIEIQRASTPQELNVIRVYDPEDDKRFRVYTVGMVELPVLPPVEGRKRYSPFDVNASANPELDNIDANASDGDLATRWSAEGEQTLTLDLGEAKQIGGFAVACMNGAARKYYFAVEVSEDGDTFETVYSGETSGTTDGYEIFRTGRQVSARYVRYRGKGNSVNSWNSITEFAVLE